MRFIGEKGQAFSTFKLLIAAIVAVVILVILLSILGYIDFSPRNQPLVGASDALKEAYQVPSQLVTNTQSVTFTKDYTLSRRAIVERANIGISEDQICLTLGDFQGMTTSGFEGGVICSNVTGDCSNENKITYRGGGAKNIKFSVLCYEGAELPDIVGTGPEAIYEDIDEDWVNQCECVTDADLQKQVCCMIALRVVR